MHWTDQIHRILGAEKYPVFASAAGGIFIRQPTPLTNPPGATVPDTPDTLAVHWDFGDCVAAWEHRQYAGNSQEWVYPKA